MPSVSFVMLVVVSVGLALPKPTEDGALVKQTERHTFSQMWLTSLSAPATRQTIYDMKNQTLGLQLEPTGRKLFFWFRYVAGQPKWKTIGPWPNVSLDTARQKAEEYDGTLATWQKEGSCGANPFETKRGSMTVGELLEDVYGATTSFFAKAKLN
jgi:hypothetical protein